MKINIEWHGKYFEWNRYWFFYLKRYTYVKGFWGRFFGIWFNIRENNATEKLVELFKESGKRG